MSETNQKIIIATVTSFILGVVSTYLIQKYLIKQKNNQNDEIQMKRFDEERSTTTASGGGIQAYETWEAVDEYLLFHYGQQRDILPYQNGPVEALQFVAKCAKLAEKYCEILRDFTGESGESCALDVGCAVGGMSFELARYFENVLGIDYSHHFIAAAQEMKAEGCATCTIIQEGEITQQIQVQIPSDIDCTRVKFSQGDACNLPENLPQFDAVLAVNLICRLPDPINFLKQLPKIIKKGGILVLVSPYSWLKSWTEKQKWLGGFYDENKKPVFTQNVISELMISLGFELKEEADLPFLIREHQRKFQWGCSYATVWKKI